MAKSKVLSFLIILTVIAVVVFFVWGKINPNINIVSEILAGSVTGIIAVVAGLIILIAFIRFLRGSAGR